MTVWHAWGFHGGREAAWGQGGKSPDGGCEGHSEERVSVLIPESWCYRFPHKGYFEVLTPRISECDLI